jgi:GH18 family chitinase
MVKTSTKNYYVYVIATDLVVDFLWNSLSNQFLSIEMRAVSSHTEELLAI